MLGVNPPEFWVDMPQGTTKHVRFPSTTIRHSYSVPGHGNIHALQQVHTYIHINKHTERFHKAQHIQTNPEGVTGTYDGSSKPLK